MTSTTATSTGCSALGWIRSTHLERPPAHRTIAHWSVSDTFAPAERAVLAYTDCLAGQQGSMPREVTDPVKTFLDDETVYELTYITALHGMHAVIARALRLEFDNRDDPIIGVAAPDGFVARHFLTAPTPPAR